MIFWQRLRLTIILTCRKPEPEKKTNTYTKCRTLMKWHYLPKSFELTWYLQFVFECFRFEAAEPGWIFLHVPWFLLETSHWHSQAVHLLKELLIFSLFIQLGPTSTKQLPYFFTVILQQGHKMYLCERQRKPAEAWLISLWFYFDKSCTPK